MMLTLPSRSRSVPLSLLTAVGLAWLSVGAAAAETSPTSKEKEQQLIAVLRSNAAPAEKAITCKRLAIFGSPEAVPALAPLLADPELSSWARIALQAIPGPAADAALRDALGTVRGRLLVGVINTIGVRRDPQAVTGLAAALKSADADVASAAAEALGHIGGDAVAKVLEPSLTSAPVEVRSAVASGCVLCAEGYLAAGNRDAAVRLYDAVRKADVPKPRRIEATRGAVLARQSAGIPLLLEQLRSPDKDFVSIGLRTARELPGREVTEALAAELERSGPERQPLLLLALADRHDAAVLPAVLSAARGGSTQLRIVAVRTLERLGNVASVPVLLQAATEDDAQLAQAGKIALLKLEGPEVDGDLLARLPSAEGKTLQVLLDLAGQRRIAAALPAATRGLEAEDPLTRRAAIESVGALGEEKQVAELVRLLPKTANPQERESLQKALTAICGRSGARCAPALLPLAKSADSALRMTGLHLLASVGGSAALAAVTSAVNDSDASVQDDAVSLLATWPNNWPDDVSVAEPLLALAKSGKKLPHQVQGIRGYLQYVQENKTLTDPQKVGKIKELLPLIQRPEEKRVAIAVLGALPTPAALELLLSLAPDRGVTEEACQAIANLAAGNSVKELSKEQRQKALQTVIEKSQNSATRKKAEAGLKAIE